MKSDLRCVVVGAGGHAAVVIEALLACRPVAVAAVVDANPAIWGKDVLGFPVIGGDDCLARLVDEGVTHFVIGVGSVGIGAPRNSLYEIAETAGLTPLTIVHPRSVVSQSAVLGAGAVVLANATVAARTVIGRNAIVNNGATIDHDCVLSDNVHVATGAVVAGGVSIGALSFVGAGAVVRHAISIGTQAVVGAGAVVIRDVADGETVVGNPACVLSRFSLNN